MLRQECAAPPPPTSPAPPRRSPAARSLLAAVADLRTLFLNFQHLLNTFRPHEAREELIAIVRQQVEAKRQLIAELDAACEKALEGFRQEAAADGEAADADDPMDVGEPVPVAQPPAPPSANGHLEPAAPAVKPAVAPQNDAQTLARLMERLERVPR